jgi:DNA-binding transcriptional MerR regulator
LGDYSLSSSSTIPSFNLKVVVAETGLKPDTIRAWERRYGLPSPARTSGHHRLYSEHDILTLKWLVARRREGLSISKAVRLWHRLEANGEDPFQASPFEPDRGPQEPPAILPGRSLEDARQAWVEACLGFDEARAEQVVAEAFAELPLETVCTFVLQAGLAAIGDLWYANRATVQQEHFASELAIRRLEVLVSATARPRHTERILVGCAIDEAHTFPSLLLVLLLRRRGWDVVFLGADVPLARLDIATDQVKPIIAVLTAQLIHGAAMLQEMGFLLERKGVRMAYGGLIFNRVPELRSRIPGEFLGEQLDRAPQVLEGLLRSEPRIPRVPDRDPASQSALDHYRDQRGILATQLWRELKAAGIQHSYLEEANRIFEQGIVASLSLGDIAYLGDDLRWVSTLLANRGVNHGSLETYLRAYRQAARDNLDSRAAPLLSWFDRLTDGTPAP